MIWPNKFVDPNMCWDVSISQALPNGKPGYACKGWAYDSPNSKSVHLRFIAYSDNYDELLVWCDLNGVKLAWK